LKENTNKLSRTGTTNLFAFNLHELCSYKCN